MRFASPLLLFAACYGPAGEAPCTVRCAGVGSPCPGAMQCGAFDFCVQPGGATCGPGGEVIGAFVADSSIDADAEPCSLVPAAVTDTGLGISHLALRHLNTCNTLLGGKCR